MSLSKEFKEEIITKFGGTDKNTGKAEVQVALFSNRISDLTGHLQKHPKDKHSRRGLLMLVSKRKKALKYLQNVAIDRYRQVIADLDLRK
ncbi:30S ribosomal protein S15 [Chlorobium phaeovibrioides]|uniref:Small ribosomal subunit protein uS15 n=2 Tax=Chlorobium phaeovibrioides TaxID=1094 RepID=RS15_CHLPM|nr:30S ribosomal protein S15 [Chlorobium phaeovibrioides]A4SGF8.1 RecName: Full=Small ribosomal subunit protein uS15; AltName: Full=30S ribosomal protein S15 [Chlorobium phaeovibrioides DSM 265]NQU45495.1 30S ribosomal protein S15 [Chlorobium sp.]KAA6230622.1 30S ribosomal protein S15 [Chlorobium phaeovibrioides]MDT9546377.1 30S ribosomal protein S15 [Chlorobium phaeovibrioides]MWV54338.1 30S ribosomal protein S15 [Chlorobium phaeovibrioides]QEQ56460.1 30S ribosomal protein S15 [Chlorobium ph